MALPNGFDPRKMTFNNTPPISIPYNNYSSSQRYRRSWWRRFSEGVSEVGNWLAEHTQNAIHIIMLVAFLGLVGYWVVGIIVTWVKAGFWAALFSAFLMSIVAVVVFYVGAVVTYVVGNVVFYGLRMILWNGWTLVLTILLAAGITVACMMPRSSDTQGRDVVSAAVYTTRYVCTASTLNVREMPDRNAAMIGRLRQGEEVDVVDTVNGFVKFHVTTADGRRMGYASMRYLRRR